MHQFAIEKKSGTIGQALCQLPNDVARKKDIPANMLLFIYDDTLLHKSKMFMKKKKKLCSSSKPRKATALFSFETMSNKKGSSSFEKETISITHIVHIFCLFAIGAEQQGRELSAV